MQNNERREIRTAGTWTAGQAGKTTEQSLRCYTVLLHGVAAHDGHNAPIPFQAIVKSIPWTPFAITRVPSPRKNKPCTPSFSITSFTACPYVTGVSEDCLVTLTTRIEFEQVSETNEEQNPINALRPSLPNVLSYLGKFSF